MNQARLPILFLMLSAFFRCTGSSTTPKATTVGSSGVTNPETMVFSAEAAPEPAAAQLEKLAQRLETAQKWGRPLLLRTVFNRLKIPLPEACARWGHVQVIMPGPGNGEATDQDAPQAPITRFLFVVRELAPVFSGSPETGPDDSPEAEPDGEPLGPDAEPAGKKRASLPDRPIAFHTCAVLLSPGTSAGRLRIGVVPLLSSREPPQVMQSDAVEDFLLMHLALPGKTGTGQTHPLTGAQWSPGSVLLFFSRGNVGVVGAWPENAGPVPDEEAGFSARLRLSVVFRRLVLVLEAIPSVVSGATDDSDKSDVSGDTSPVAGCAWIDAGGRLTVISKADRNLLSREAGLAGCAVPAVDHVPVAAPPEKEEEEREVP